MSLLSICQDAARELPIAVPSTVASATDDNDAQLLMRLARKEGYELSRRANWTALRKEHSFTTVAQESQTGSIPSDLSHFVEETMFNRSLRRPVLGPITPQEWQEHKSSLSVAVDPHFIVRGSTMLFTPVPGAGESIYYEYISNRWAISGDGTPKATFTDDNDTHIWKSDEILVLGVIWRWRKHKGLPFQEDLFEYERIVADEIMRDGGKRRIQLNDRIGIVRRGRAQMTDYNTIPNP